MCLFVKIFKFNVFKFNFSEITTDIIDIIVIWDKLISALIHINEFFIEVSVYVMSNAIIIFHFEVIFYPMTCNVFEIFVAVSSLSLSRSKLSLSGA